jgi:PilZ domain
MHPFQHFRKATSCSSGGRHVRCRAPCLASKIVRGAGAVPRCSQRKSRNLGLSEDFRNLVSHEGEVLNLSENGVYFTSRAKLSVGAPLEMHLTLPRELTGRNPEQVRCSARVVHVEDRSDLNGIAGIGAIVDRFEAVAAAHDWSN